MSSKVFLKRQLVSSPWMPEPYYSHQPAPRSNKPCTSADASGGKAASKQQAPVCFFLT